MTAGTGELVGTVTGLWRYPVKSMAAEPLESAAVSWAGLAGDRRWAFVRSDSARNGFPWYTIREHPAMWRYRPRLVDPGRPDKSPVEVQAPGGGRYDVTDPRLGDELGGSRVMRLDRGLFDEAPVSVIGTGTVSALCALAGVPGSALRFRPNLVVSPASGAAYAEDDWVGHCLRIGTAIVRVDQRDSRCVMINVNPETGRPDGPVLKAAGRHHDACAGVYGSTVRPGLIAVGDPVTITG